MRAFFLFKIICFVIILEMKKRITEKTILAEVLRIEGSKEILEKYNVPCLFCPFALLEANNLTLGQIAEMYELNLSGLLKELNQLKKKK